jgi:hypothetical protein
MSDADMVPRSRLNEEIAKRKELEADHNALKATLTTVEAKAAEADTLRAQLATATAEHDTFRVGVEAGITDPEGLSLARWFYDKAQPAEGEERPSFADYMSKLKTDPASRPKGLTSYFADATPAAPAPAQAAPAQPPAGTPAKPAAPAQPAQPAAPRSTAALPPPSTGAAPAPAPSPSAAGWTRENIADPATYAANRDALLKQASAGLASRLGSR